MVTNPNTFNKGTVLTMMYCYSIKGTAIRSSFIYQLESYRRETWKLALHREVCEETTPSFPTNQQH